ncbi:hypothetical protein ETD83_14770 [Actinomadura soli]|uniref:Uncharacterized protein n=1 Tax=Actinomadura soli TaxID=2508997 RepID=A0A5C4JE29_9ACTN|nr:hypothetical protein [Actinomadura soli]TMR01258.1 hypothetical protein ETD83_14770 [Actinomadura soli]
MPPADHVIPQWIFNTGAQSQGVAVGSDLVITPVAWNRRSTDSCLSLVGLLLGVIIVLYVAVCAPGLHEAGEHSHGSTIHMAHSATHTSPAHARESAGLAAPDGTPQKYRDHLRETGPWPALEHHAGCGDWAAGSVRAAPLAPPALVLIGMVPPGLTGNGPLHTKDLGRSRRPARADVSGSGRARLLSLGCVLRLFIPAIADGAVLQHGILAE